MMRPEGDIDRGAWFDFWRGSACEWDRWHNRTEPTSLPAEKRRAGVYAIALAIFSAGAALGVVFERFAA